MAVGYAKDFSEPSVRGDLLLPRLGDGGKLDFRVWATSQVWAGVLFAPERLGDGRGRTGADIDSDAPVSTKD